MVFRAAAFAALLAVPAGAQVLTRAQAITAPIGGFAAPALVPSAVSPVLLLSAPALVPALLASPLSPVLALRPAFSAPASSERPLPASPAEVTAFVLDLDGNVFGTGFPTKIILFKKNGDEELPVPTAHFAAIEKQVGKHYIYGGANLKDYELRGDASFREFFGPKFAEDLKYAVENLPASEWQGPSWGAMVRALNDPFIVPYVYVLTARQHTPEQLLEGFRYLQAAGHIRYLPKVENLHGVGSSYRIAERKAELMMEFIDTLQALPFGEDSGPHTIGFSDDTWANYEKMRDALTGALRALPGSWNRVKIVLFFTGSNDLEHKSEAVVLNSDGTIRPYVVGEPR